MSQDKTIVLHTYPGIAQAQIMQDILQENGIASMLNDENVMGLDPVGGVELRVFEKDKEAAERILSDKQSLNPTDQ